MKTIKELCEFVGGVAYAFDYDGDLILFFNEAPKFYQTFWEPKGAFWRIDDTDFIDCSELDGVDWQDSLRKVKDKET